MGHLNPFRYLVRISKLGVLEIRLVFESVRVYVFADEGCVSRGVSPDYQKPHDKQNKNQGYIEPNMDVQSVEVSRRPFGLE